MIRDKVIHFSVVIPLYNKADYIQKTLESVLAQSYSNFEVIVVDDGSIDESRSIVGRVGDSRVHLIVQENAGVSAARNRGVAEAKCDYVAFLDADDFWGENYLEAIAELICQYPDENVFGARYALVQNGVTVPVKLVFDPKDRSVVFDMFAAGIEDKGYYLPLNASNFAVRKDLFNEVGGFDRRIRYFEDYDLLLRLGLRSKVAFFNERALSFYNKDVPVENRTTGKFYDFRYHMLFYVDKFNSAMQINPEVMQYFDGFKVRRLCMYIEENKYVNEVKSVLCGVDLGRQLLKHRVYYSFRWWGFLFARINRIRYTSRDRLKAVFSGRK